MPVCVPRTHISNRPAAPIGNISLLIFHLSPYLPIKKRAQPNFFEPSAAKALHLHYSLLFIIYSFLFSRAHHRQHIPIHLKLYLHAAKAQTVQAFGVVLVAGAGVAAEHAE